MKVRSVTIAFVSSVFLAALGATSSPALATSSAAHPLATQAYSALAAGDNERAIALYSQAIESRSLAPELLANALLNRALAYQQMNKQTLAIDDYTAALSLDAMSAELRATALYNRGLSQQKISLLSLAIEDFTSALLLNPSFSHAFLSRGNALRDSGQYLFALSDFERALKFSHPDPARVYFSQAQTYEMLQRPIDARRALEAALAANPNYTLAREKLAALDGADQLGATQVAQNTDDVLTGSISPVGGNSLVHKPDFPAGVEPPESLLASTEPQVVTAEIAPLTSGKTPKLYTDRLPEVAEEVSLKPDKMIEVASVPQIPHPTKKATKVEADPVETSSIEPVKDIPAGWGVQIASVNSEAAAWSTWKKMQVNNAALAAEKPIVVKADLGTKGIYYRLKLVGFAAQSDAQSRCAKLKAKGVACFVGKLDG